MALVTLHMTWQQQHQQQRRRRGVGGAAAAAPLGLKNLGNTCYLNSVLQCLTYTPPLAQFCLSNQHSSLCKSLIVNREKECPFCILERQIARSFSLEGALVDSPVKIQKCITLFAEHFRWGRQEDAHEFLRYVIDSCHNTCLKLLKKLSSSSPAKGAAANGNGSVGNGVAAAGPNTVMKDIFGGALLSQVKCLSCKGESNKTDEIMDISLDLFHSNSLKDALGRFFQPEILDGNNKYNCSKCKKLSVAKKQMFILRAPNVLVIQLKRFESINGGKINKNIEFEEVLVLSKFMSSTSQDMQPEYNLFGSIVHSGFSPESGHYYAYIKDPLGRWYCCNDAHVSPSSTQEVLSEKVYILFYLRNNQSPKSSKYGPPSITKASNSGGGEVLLHQKPAELPKPPIFKLNGVTSKNNVTTILKNGRIAVNAQIKSINHKNAESKGVTANGNGHSEFHANGVVEKNGDKNLSPAGKKTISPHINGSTEKVKVEHMVNLPSTKSNAVNGISFSNMQNGRKQIQTSNRNCHSNSLKPVVREDNATKSLATVSGEVDHTYPPTCTSVLTKKDSVTVAPKRKSCAPERDEDLGVHAKQSYAALENDASCKNQNTGQRNRSEELEEFKELIASEASSELRSCGWVDRVHNFMRTRKRICTQGTGISLDDTELRRQLLIDAKRTFISQIPESLKEHLIQRLRAFSQEKPLIDP